MKKQLKSIVALGAAAVMALASVMTASAEVALEGTQYKLPSTEIVYDGYTADDMHYFDIDGAELYVTFTIEGTADWNGCDKEQGAYLYNEDGYEWRYAYATLNDTYTRAWWALDVENSSDWESVSEYGIEVGGVSHLYNFKVVKDGVEYPKCKLIGGACDVNDYWREDCMFVLVPVGYDGDITYSIYGGKLENEESAKSVRNDDAKCTFLISGDGSSLNQQQAAVPVWKEDSTGWKLENPDGSYVMNAWYQSPESGLWYYLGGDGYMLTNTTTPDGYQVNGEGVWIQ